MTTYLKILKVKKYLDIVKDFKCQKVLILSNCIY